MNSMLHLDQVEQDASKWLTEIIGNLKISHVGAISHEKFLSKSTNTREVLAKLLVESVKLVNRQNKLIGNLEMNEKLKTELIDSQQSVIGLQKLLIDAKTVQLETLQSNQLKTVNTAVREIVETAVTDSMDSYSADVKSYSQAVQQMQNSSSTSADGLSTETLKNVVRTVITEEDSTKNIMIFGLPEETDEKLRDKVSEVFLQLGEKPRCEASRVGKKKPGSSKRPVKVTLSSSTIVQHILSRARCLKNSAKLKTVFVRPDRSEEQRASQRELVAQLKRKRTDEPDKKHFIRGGLIATVDK